MKFNLRKSAVQKNIFSNFVGIGIQLFNQVLLVPLYLTFWSKELYSDWIIISAISSLFSMSELGLNTVTANNFTMSYANGKFKDCCSLLTNNYLLVGLMALLITSSLLLYLSIFDIKSILSLHSLSSDIANYVFVLLTLKIFIGMGCSVINAIYRATSKTYKAVLLNNIETLTEGAVILMSLLTGLSITVMVTIYIFPKVLIFLYRQYDARKLFNYSFKIADINIPLLRKSLLPSLTFMNFTIGNSIIYQGFTFIVNKFYGADAVVIYNTTRTLTNFARQAISTIQHSVWPEYSIAFGKQNLGRMKSLHRKAFSLSIIGYFFIAVILLFFGPLIYQIWTNGQVVFNFYLMLAFLVILLVESLWITSSVCLMATNNHSKIGTLYVITAIVAIGIAVVVQRTSNSLVSIVYSLLVVHIPLFFYAIKEALRMNEDTLKQFTIGVLKL